MTAAAWLGVLRAHQSQAEEALALLRPAARAPEGVAHTAATLHSLLFTGHAHAVAGRPGAGPGRVRPVHRRGRPRQVPRFAGRAVNFAGWVLRSLGAAAEAPRSSARPWSWAQREGMPEVTIAALQDLAEQCVQAGDADGARDRLAQARAPARRRPGLRLAAGPQAPADHRAAGAAARRPGGGPGRRGRAGDAGRRARRAPLRQRGPRPGPPGPPRAAACRSTSTRSPPTWTCVEAAVAVEAWWWTGEAAADFAGPGLAGRRGRPGRAAGPPGRRPRGTLRQAAARRLERWRAAAQ